jgi:CRISPR-associated endonuclease/helicase Cas3
MLKSLDCLKRPFLEVYWKSEAFLEIAKPLLELETVLAGLPQEDLVINLYETLQAVLGGNKEWNYYRQRIRVIGSISLVQ